MKKALRNIACWFVPSSGLRTAIRRGQVWRWREARRLLRAEKSEHMRPQCQIAVIAMFRDEAPYLREWIEYHIMMGISRFYLFDNESVDNPRAVLDPYIKSGIVIFRTLPDREINRLKQKYGDYNKPHVAHWLALEQVRETAKWVAIIDIDEFILPKKDADIPAFLSRFAPDVSQILLGWNVFGSGGHREKPDGLVIENYTRRGPIPDSRAFKAIVNPRAIAADMNHYHAVVGKTADENGRMIRGRIHEYAAPSEICPVNHYMTRSESECLAKCAKNKKSLHPDRYGADFFGKYDRNEILDETMLKHAPFVRAAVEMTDKERFSALGGTK
jgi:hypothetical protein